MTAARPSIFWQTLSGCSALVALSGCPAPDEHTETTGFGESGTDIPATTTDAGSGGTTVEPTTGELDASGSTSMITTTSSHDATGTGGTGGTGGDLTVLHHPVALAGGPGFARLRSSATTAGSHFSYGLEVETDEWTWAPSSFYQNIASALTRTPDGGLLVASSGFTGGIGMTWPQVHRLDALGTELWSFSEENGAGHTHRATNAIETDDGMVYVSTQPDASTSNLIVFKEGGQLQRHYKGIEGAIDIAAGPDGCLLLRSISGLARHDDAGESLESPAWHQPPWQPDSTQWTPNFAIATTPVGVWRVSNLFVDADGTWATLAERFSASGEAQLGLALTTVGGGSGPLIDVVFAGDGRLVHALEIDGSPQLTIVEADGTGLAVGPELPAELEIAAMGLTNDGRLGVWGRDDGGLWWQTFDVSFGPR